MRRLPPFLLSVLLLASGSPLRADRPYPTSRKPKTAFSKPKPGPRAVPADAGTNASQQWRIKEKARVPAASSGASGEEGNDSFKKPAPPPSSDGIPVKGPPAVPKPAKPLAEIEEDQWRRSPTDRRWETWRRFPAEKQAELWRGLGTEERDGYWDRMNVHERSTLWLKMTTEEKERTWARMTDAERGAVCDALPPNEKALWATRLPAGTAHPTSPETGKFRPAHPEPGFQPKSRYKGDEDLDQP